MNLNPRNPHNVQPLVLQRKFGPGLIPPYHPPQQIAGAVTEPHTRQSTEPVKGSLETWQRVPFTTGDSIGYAKHKIYGERRRPMGASAFERRYQVIGPLVNGYFPTISTAKTAISRAEDAQKEQQRIITNKKEAAAQIIEEQIPPKGYGLPTTGTGPITKKIEIVKKSVPGEQLRTTQPAARAPVDIPDPRVQATSRTTTAAPAPGAGQSKKKSNALLIAAIIGVPIVAGMFID